VFLALWRGEALDLTGMSDDDMPGAAGQRDGEDGEHCSDDDGDNAWSQVFASAHVQQMPPSIRGALLGWRGYLGRV
jgi:hypothetical protein